MTYFPVSHITHHLHHLLFNPLTQPTLFKVKTQNGIFEELDNAMV